MRIHDMRVLRDFGIDKGEWAVLFAASYYEPIPWRRFLELAAWESDGAVTEAEISEALTRCIDKSWVMLSHDVPALFASDEPEETVVLTELGYQLKNSVFVAMMETVPLAFCEPYPLIFAGILQITGGYGWGFAIAAVPAGIVGLRLLRRRERGSAAESP